MKQTSRGRVLYQLSDMCAASSYQPEALAQHILTASTEDPELHVFARGVMLLKDRGDGAVEMLKDRVEESAVWRTGERRFQLAGVSGRLPGLRGTSHEA